MHNAHLRMGRLEYVKAATHERATPTHIGLSIDHAIVEPSLNSGESPRCHLLSVFGGEQEIGAIVAAIAEEARFMLSGPEFASHTVTLGERSRVFRGSLQVPGRKQPLRHLIALSHELGQTQAGENAEAERTVVYSREPQFLVYRLGVRFGLPVLPDWSAWIASELDRRGLVNDLPGLGCRPILVRASKRTLLHLIATGLRTRRLQIPDDASIVEWNVPQTFCPASA
jgi:hypothetical protein